MLEEVEEEEPIGKVPYGDLECPGTYLIKEDESIIKIELRSETFSTVNVRKHFSNPDQKGRLFVDYSRAKDEIIFVLDEIVDDDLEIEDLGDYLNNEES